jgi:hypothetical protein
MPEGPISFARTFGGGSGNLPGATGASAPAAQRDPATIWLNVGYPVDVPGKDEAGNDVVNQIFVSLPVGIPVDTMKHIDISRIRNKQMLDLAVARNKLFDDLMAAGKTLEPGQGELVSGLSIQLRRVSEASTEADSSGSENVFLAASPVAVG